MKVLELNKIISKISPLAKYSYYKYMSYFKPTNERKIIILGLQKSGTSAIANLLSYATNLSVTSDIKRAIADSTLPIRLGYKMESFEKFLSKYSFEFSRDIVKEPFLTYFYPELKQSFPNAKYIYIVRDPFQNIRSVLNRLKIPGDLPSITFTDWEELRKTPVWKFALQFSLYDQGENYVSSLASRWNHLANMYLKNKKDFILVKYEDFNSSKTDFIRSLAQNLDLEVFNDIDSVKDVAFQPKGDPNVDLLDFFGEINYDTINRICAHHMKDFGYS